MRTSHRYDRWQLKLHISVNDKHIIDEFEQFILIKTNENESFNNLNEKVNKRQKFLIDHSLLIN